MGRLLELMRANGLTLVRHTLTGQKLDGGGAVAEFTADLRWSNFAGVAVNRPVNFRATFELDGSEWRLRSCRIVGSPRLE
jgi:hypothetical protein